MKGKVLQTIKQYNLITNGDKIVIGVSGGPDSISLLHILNSIKEEINFQIYVAHINHMIREVATEEAKYVQNFCNKLNIQCFIKNADVTSIAKAEKRGTEEIGRKIRYDFFNEIAEKVGANKIATAHNKNDKVETILLNIVRGSGLSGLKGIEAIRNGRYIRPLIAVKREDIEEYCKKHALNPKYDESNLETIYTRNKVRNIVLPYIKKEFNPNIVETIYRLSELVTEENEYLEQVTEKAFNEIQVISESNKLLNASIVLDLKKFNNLELVIKRRIILYTINKVLGTTKNIEKTNIDDIIKLCARNIGNKFLTPIKEIKILIKNKKIFFIGKK